jgi:ABC-type cobalamin transport system ATPase subunit
LLLDQGLVQAQGRVEQVLTAQRLAQVFGLEADLQAQDQGYALQIHGVMSCMLDQKRVR